MGMTIDEATEHLGGEIMEKTPIEIVYEVVVNNIDKIDNEIAYLKGKREAYNDIRLDLYPYLGEEKKDGEDNT